MSHHKTLSGEVRQRVVAEFDKNSLEKIKVVLERWKNQTYCDIRVYFLDEEKAEHPTKRGLCISTDLLSELKRAIDAALVAVEEGDAQN